MPYAIMMSTRGRGSEREWEFTDIVYESGQEAGAWVKQENSYRQQTGSRLLYKAIKVGIEDPRLWRERIKAQLEKGELKRVPWIEDEWYMNYHFRDSGLYEHIDPDNGTKVRFIASPTEGMQGKFTSMTPGRFLRRYIGEIPPDKLDEWCAKMGLDMTTSPLLLATTPEEIVRVYTEGPHSCMAYKHSRSEGPFMDIDRHPVEAYGNSDIAVAYIERAGEIKARCIVCPEKKIFGRIYGDRSRLLERLSENDYIEDWDGFAGCRIRQLRTKHGQLILPYIDGDILGVDLDGEDWLVLSHKPHIIGKSPYGIPETESCMSCGRVGPLDSVQDDDYDELQYRCAEGC